MTETWVGPDDNDEYRLELDQTPEARPHGEGCWYKHFIEECPVCGRGDEWKERRYTPPPPKDSPERWEFKQRYDYCDVL